MPDYTICALNFWAERLKTAAAMEVLVPPGAGPFPVLYLLHGLGADCTCWRRNLAINRHLANLRMIVAMPSASKSYYVNGPLPAGLPYEDHIVEDVVGLVDRTFHTIPDRRARGVAGVSMGGYGAMMLALRHPELFGAVSSMSGSLYFAALSHPRGDEYITALMNALPPGRYDLLARASELAGAEGPRPAIRFDCGKSDFLLECNRRFAARLAEVGLEHEFVEYDGGHNWKYWDAVLGDTLKFMTGRLATQ